jgi:glucose-1-phosphate thymidylyltransferase
MLAKIRDVLIIVNKGQLSEFKKLFPNDKNLGLKIIFKEQEQAKGLPDAFIIGEKFINNSCVAMILGDNFFYGQHLSELLYDCVKLKTGAKIILHHVRNPQLFGVAKINQKNKKIVHLVEKPKKFVSNYAITGIYFFDKNVVSYAKKLRMSKRGELEIIDLINQYKKKTTLTAEILGRGGAWLDTGSISDYYKTSNFVQAVENRQGVKVACLEEIALLNRWIGKREILNQIKFYGNCEYSNYLRGLIN